LEEFYSNSADMITVIWQYRMNGKTDVRILQ